MYREAAKHGCPHCSLRPRQRHPRCAAPVSLLCISPANTTHADAYVSCHAPLLLPPAAIPYPELLAYAQSLSAFTSAPPNMPDLAPGQPPPPLFFPPFPNEEKMRRGHMNDEAPLGILGETHSVGKRESRSIRPSPVPCSQSGRPRPLSLSMSFLVLVLVPSLVLGAAAAAELMRRSLRPLQRRRYRRLSSFRPTLGRTHIGQTSGRPNSSRSSTWIWISTRICSRSRGGPSCYCPLLCGA